MQGQRCLRMMGARVSAETRSQQVGSSEFRTLPLDTSPAGTLAHLALLLSHPRATEEAEKTTTTYLDTSTHLVQGEVPPRTHPCPLLGLPPWAS